MLMTLESTEPITRLVEDRIRVCNDNRARSDSKCGIDKSEIGDNEVDGIKVGDNEVEKKSQKLSKSKNLFKSKKR